MKQLSVRTYPTVESPSSVRLTGNSIIFQNSGNIPAIINGTYPLFPNGGTLQLGLQNDDYIISQEFKIDFVGAGFPNAFGPLPANPNPRVDILVMQTDDCRTAQYTPK